jgi:hypothetical protein
MSVQIGKYTFEGPFAAPDPICNNSGVYAVLTRCLATEPYTVIDIGESGGICDRLTNHDRSVQWTRANKGGGIHFAVGYCNEQDRMRIESELRAIYSPACGVR